MDNNMKSNLFGFIKYDFKAVYNKIKLVGITS